jgi:hypothetical protein
MRNASHVGRDSNRTSLDAVYVHAKYPDSESTAPPRERLSCSRTPNEHAPLAPRVRDQKKLGPVINSYHSFQSPLL